MTTILVIIGLVVDIGLGANAYAHVKKLEKLLAHVDSRLSKLEG